MCAVDGGFQTAAAVLAVAYRWQRLLRMPFACVCGSWRMSAYARHGAATMVMCCLDALVTFHLLITRCAVVLLGGVGAAAPALWSQAHARSHMTQYDMTFASWAPSPWALLAVMSI
jgi:hypothetical protein